MTRGAQCAGLVHFCCGITCWLRGRCSRSWKATCSAAQLAEQTLKTRRVWCYVRCAQASCNCGCYSHQLQLWVSQPALSMSLGQLYPCAVKPPCLVGLQLVTWCLCGFLRSVSLLAAKGQQTVGNRCTVSGLVGAVVLRRHISLLNAESVLHRVYTSWHFFVHVHAWPGRNPGGSSTDVWFGCCC